MIDQCRGGETWICLQLGAREHYAVPRALKAAGAAPILLTDLWTNPRSILCRLAGSLRQRHHGELDGTEVHSSNLRLLCFELVARTRGLKGWPLILARNHWFQGRSESQLSRMTFDDSKPGKSRNPVLFAFSNAALRGILYAKSRGWRTILGQIDPGPESELNMRLAREAGLPPATVGAPPKYWADWRREVALADRVVVNSAWSRDELIQEGIPPGKLAVIPLAFSPPAAARGFQRVVPKSFSRARPLQVLFLGQVTARKGLRLLVEVMRRMVDDPVEFRVVGPRLEPIPSDVEELPSIEWVGAVDRAGVDRFYREADIFLFPTLSDGFGLTQLEAQSWRLPIIASRNCGDVVRHGWNGLLLESPCADAIIDSLRAVIAEPSRLRDWAASSRVGDRFSLSSVGGMYRALLQDIGEHSEPLRSARDQFRRRPSGFEKPGFPDG